MLIWKRTDMLRLSETSPLYSAVKSALHSRLLSSQPHPLADLLHQRLL